MNLNIPTDVSVYKNQVFILYPFLKDKDPYCGNKSHKNFFVGLKNLAQGKILRKIYKGKITYI